MANTDKEVLQEDVSQHKRMASGAWINGEQLKEESKATQPKANSDHGNFTNKGIDKKNA